MKKRKKKKRKKEIRELSKLVVRMIYFSKILSSLLSNAEAKFIWCKMYHCLKSVRIRSFCGLYFPAFGLNTERYPFLSLFNPNAEKYGREKLLIWTLFTQCISYDSNGIIILQ